MITSDDLRREFGPARVGQFPTEFRERLLELIAQYNDHSASRRLRASCAPVTT